MLKEFVCTTTIWIEAESKEAAFERLENINNHIRKVFSVDAASDSDRVTFEGVEIPEGEERS